ncbi:hypothetical protein ACFOD0_16750 [Shewanella intestini]|uniref:NAD-dependent epimerase/dehydratase family protein n=1 Tax=Shewanella intestini TaxID=2017544 RepID=A0ABS5I5F2_9GAMM|nr:MULTISPECIES: hypothetical protein [Shewanella]MBR9729141.1 hypothetical protein [Shewanella intestini]MRG37288.1 hypothetical protein [Shewanella sp. XMDDZSB0408]
MSSALTTNTLPKNVAIAGATGLVGQALLVGLLKDDHVAKVIVIGRRQPQIPSSSKLSASQLAKLKFVACELVNLQHLPLNDVIHRAYCCLGTTIKKAGSQTQFINVDKTAAIDFAQMILTANQRLNATHISTQLHMITAHGATPNSKVFYNRIKGETEQAIAKLGFDQIHFYRPSLLLGKRHEARLLEDIGQRLSTYFIGMFIGPMRSIKPITAKQVASAMLSYSGGSREELARFEVSNCAPSNATQPNIRLADTELANTALTNATSTETKSMGNAAIKPVISIITNQQMHQLNSVKV